MVHVIIYICIQISISIYKFVFLLFRYPYHKTYGENTCTLSESCNQDNMKPYDGTDQGYKLYLYVR